MAKCIVCNERPAVLRDRENPTSNRKKVCRECHVQRLVGDLKIIMATAARSQSDAAKEQP